MPVNNLLAGLVDAANILVAQMDEHLGFGYPDAIRKSIKIGSPQSNGVETFIEIMVGGSDARMAAAFEYGSGEHRTRGTPERYKISPKAGGPGYLAFPTERWPNYEPPPNVNYVFKFPGMVSPKNYVMHPGIVARPFIVPSIREVKDDIRRVIGQAFRADINLRGGRFQASTFTVQL